MASRPDAQREWLERKDGHGNCNFVSEEMTRAAGHKEAKKQTEICTRGFQSSFSFCRPWIKVDISQPAVPSLCTIVGTGVARPQQPSSSGVRVRYLGELTDAELTRIVPYASVPTTALPDTVVPALTRGTGVIKVVAVSLPASLAAKKILLA